MIHPDERDTPKYKLKRVFELIEQGHYRVTRTAQNTAASDLGVKPLQIIKIVSKLKEEDFVKSQKVTTGKGWFDIYYKKIKGLLAYIKLTIEEGKTLIVVSFKEK